MLNMHNHGWLEGQDPETQQLLRIDGFRFAQPNLPELSQGLNEIKQLTNKPVAVGFGISKSAQVSMLSAVTEGIIVGSAIIKLIEAHTIKQGDDLKAGPDLVKKVGEFIGELKEATKTGY